MSLIDNLIKKAGELGEVLESKAEILEGKAIEKGKDWKQKYDNMDPEKKKDLKRVAGGVVIATVAPWYAALPAAGYALAKGQRLFQKPKEEQKETPKKDYD